MLYVYADESEQREADVYSVAAYAFDDGGLRRFEEAWKRALDDEGLSWFHMTDFENYQKDYRDWNKERHDDFIVRLIEIINGSVLCGCTSSLDVAAFNGLQPSEQSMAGPPYLQCAAICIGGVSVLFRFLAPANQPVAWILDDDPTGTAHKRIGQLQLVFQWIRDSSQAAEHQIRVDSDTRAAARTVMPLQAADILAYEAAKEGMRRFGRSSRPLRKSAERLFDLGQARMQHAFVDEAQLKERVSEYLSQQLGRIGLFPPGNP